MLFNEVISFLLGGSRKSFKKHFRVYQSISFHCFRIHLQTYGAQHTVLLLPLKSFWPAGRKHTPACFSVSLDST